ncbi:DUF962 domain-containing protein [Spongiibacter sp. KMU-158]|uniref:DUF962 domain-containing protein n=1 Tax=Spongiibacter pelagi TaxID=2760804 RepID=A0A927BXS9_9GAMM|nr:Mpo1-like protein [Spongiibacter pelagi]MBD2857520.1 DUF962 domain-containing protein [Spongiibacter pelagi]
MRDLNQWLDEYNAAHQNPRNKTIHFYCVPLIAVTTVALLWLVPLPFVQANLGQLLLIFAMFFYGYLSAKLALGMLPFVLALVAGIMLYEKHIELAMWIPASIIWIVAWYFQFVGHKAEAQKPSFFTDILFLLIGPLWILGYGYDKLGINFRNL